MSELELPIFLDGPYSPVPPAPPPLWGRRERERDREERETDRERETE
eukprot:COSAG03_NODE_29876_length_174_cov_63.440000_1_plen_46_part_10